MSDLSRKILKASSKEDESAFGAAVASCTIIWIIRLAFLFLTGSHCLFIFDVIVMEKGQTQSKGAENEGLKPIEKRNLSLAKWPISSKANSGKVASPSSSVRLPKTPSLPPSSPSSLSSLGGNNPRGELIGLQPTRARCEFAEPCPWIDQVIAEGGGIYVETVDFGSPHASVPRDDEGRQLRSNARSSLQSILATYSSEPLLGR